ncbi:kinesin-like protein KIF25 isoform X2 [Phyllopteryx taeniolatus]|uniref:kinesin-like protein KIF25 isoform X2 n=1 Tax=Phyllopteryx taeniolatus TaxID=161469 RepID=UPI002AD4925A|nr:kinesin-like protein KIF25 isoform X2 [Phyllopteryx taeniolatus]
MPLFVNRDQMFAHQVHLLEHKLRGKEERILELETENAILHIRLAENLAKLQQEQDQKDTKASNPRQDEKKITRSAIAQLISEVQALKKGLSELFAVYVSFATELEEKSKQLQENVEQRRCSSLMLGCSEDTAESLQARLTALERSLQEEREKCGAERQRRKELHNTLAELRGNIRVHCRVRPLLHFDHVQFSTTGSGPAPSEQVIHAVSDDTVRVNCMKAGVPAQNKMFEFERVHGPEDSQEAVFEEVKPLLTSLLDGYNVCIMAYGQTGSGKTHTMMGSPESTEPSGPQQGIIVKAAAEIFRLIAEKPPASHTVEMSAMEVYNNDALDLLARDVGQRRENLAASAGSCQVSVLTQEPVCDACEVTQIMSRVLRLRSHCPTLVHADSSRSHLIVTLTVSSKSPNAQALGRRLHSAKKSVRHAAQKESWSPKCRRANPAARSSPEDDFASPASSPSLSPCPSPRSGTSPSPFRTKLQLVDLAGSECVDMTGVSGGALWEVSCINRSLSALSDVLSALAEQRPHVPYRNSKLTHLLQDAIGGDAKLLVMLCVSPTRRFLTESLQTLGFGARARQVQRDPARKKSNTLKAFPSSPKHRNSKSIQAQASK